MNSDSEIYKHQPNTFEIEKLRVLLYERVVDLPFRMSKEWIGRRIMIRSKTQMLELFSLVFITFY